MFAVIMFGSFYISLWLAFVSCFIYSIYILLVMIWLTFQQGASTFSVDKLCWRGRRMPSNLSVCLSSITPSFILCPSLLFPALSSASLPLSPTTAKGKHRGWNIERMRTVYLSWWNRISVQYYGRINLFTWWEKPLSAVKQCRGLPAWTVYWKTQNAGQKCLI